MPYLQYSHVLMLINICVIIFWSLLLVSCTSSNGLENVLLVSLSYKSPAANTTHDPLLLNLNVTQELSEQLSRSEKIIQQIRVSYVSICMALNSGIWVCNNNAEELALILREVGNGDPLNLLRLAENFRWGVVFYALIIIAIIFTLISLLLLSSFPGWHEYSDSEDKSREIKPFPSRPVSLLAAALMTAASALGFVSAFWQHIGAAGTSTLLRLLTYDIAEAQLGASAMTLGWLGAACAGITTIGLIIIIIAIRTLQALADYPRTNSQGLVGE
ncbi:Ca2+ regulator and membrane fusion protein Fig1-domain-containing protein [Biscogniauxia marginata]|nr:Ca2+ regulator and membrane fusion protein Fig1-domain-containing protein [Biscogniauxia marginata]